MRRGLPCAAAVSRRRTFIHDIGKIAVPAEILMKPEALTFEEYSLVKLHSTTGFRTVHGIDFDGPVYEVILQHHERLDGSGYPAGMREPIPEAGVLAVADVYDALTSSRPYRAGKSAQDAIEIMQQEENHRLDSSALEALVPVVLKRTEAQTGNTTCGAVRPYSQCGALESRDGARRVIERKSCGKAVPAEFWADSPGYGLYFLGRREIAQCLAR